MPEVDTSRSRRGGGRAARVEARAAGLAADMRPVRPGFEGGRFAPLGADAVARIDAAVMEILAGIGLSNATPSVVEHCTRVGAILGSDGRLRFPRQTVLDAIGTAAREVTLCARDPALDLHPGGRRVHCGTSGAAVHIVDARTGEYRDSLLRDVYDMARVVDRCDNIHFFFRTVVARDVADPVELDVNTLYAALQGTRKHVGVSFSHPDAVAAALSMLHEIAGGEAAWRERPFASTAPCFVVPPLTFAEDACNCLEAAVRGGMPVLLLAAGQAGATSPAALAGAVAQEVAETLAALVYVNAMVPGAPAILGPWPFVSDLRTGAMSGGSGEQALLMSATAQMVAHYGLPSGAAGAMADSKMPDIQAGYEKGCNLSLIANAGATMIYEAAGMHASLLGCCYETLVLDNDAIGAALRTVRGIEVSDATCSVDVIRQTVMGGPNHFLGADQTMALMLSDYYYPDLGDRLSPKEWAEKGREVALDRAERRVREILASHFPNPIPGEIDASLRARLPIRLPPEQMAPA